MKEELPSFAIPSVPIAGRAGRFAVRHIYCVGRNYAEHAKEMGGDATKEPPFFFTKAADSIAPVVPPEVGHVHYPLATRNFHHELELVVAIGGRAVKISPEQANSLVFGYAVGLDMTRRDLQIAHREKQRPWDLGKAFENAAIITAITPAAKFPALGAQRISLKVNGTVKQDGKLSDMVWSVPELISHLSRFYHLEPGDLIYTGTPAGVGPVKPGDALEGEIEGLAPLTLKIGAPE